MLIKTLKIRVLVHDFKRVLVYDSSAAVTPIETLPTVRRYHFVAIFVAGEEPIGICTVAAQANPRLVVPLLVLDVFFDADHLYFHLKGICRFGKAGGFERTGA
jgi:hypothetical protein